MKIHNLYCEVVLIVLIYKGLKRPSTLTNINKIIFCNLISNRALWALSIHIHGVSFFNNAFLCFFFPFLSSFRRKTLSGLPLPHCRSRRPFPLRLLHPPLPSRSLSLSLSLSTIFHCYYLNFPLNFLRLSFTYWIGNFYFGKYIYLKIIWSN